MPETWGTYRRSLGAALGWHMFETHSSVAATSSATLVIPALIDSNLEANFLDSVWEYQPGGSNAGEVRRPVKGGLAPATGTVTLSRPHTSASSASVPVELYGVLPPVRATGRRGLLEAANLALKECWFIDTLNIVGISTAYQYPLSTAYPWLNTEEQIIDLYVRRSGEVRDSPLSEWQFLNNADTPQFEVKSVLSSADTIAAVVYRPMNTWLNVNSSWTATATGLVNDTDQALLSENGMLQVGLYWCYEFLATEGDVSQRGYWRSMADRQRIRANHWKSNNLPQQLGRDVHWSQLSVPSRYEWPVPVLST